MLQKLFIIVVLGVVGVSGECTFDELELLFKCITPYNQQFGQAIGLGDTCNTTLITPALCASFAGIVTCTNGKSVSETECRPFAIDQINANMQIPCKIEDFAAVCTDAPPINTGRCGPCLQHGPQKPAGIKGLNTGATGEGATESTGETGDKGGSDSLSAGWTSLVMIVINYLVMALALARH